MPQSIYSSLGSTTSGVSGALPNRRAASISFQNYEGSQFYNNGNQNGTQFYTNGNPGVYTQNKPLEVLLKVLSSFHAAY